MFGLDREFKALFLVNVGAQCIKVEILKVRSKLEAELLSNGTFGQEALL